MKRKICVHIRRGDIAQIEASDSKSILKEKINGSKILHTQGLFLPYWIKKKVSSNFLRRYKPIRDYGECLKSIAKNSQESFEVVLICDGMIKLANNLKENYNYIFTDSEISVCKIENTLNA